MIDIYDRVFAYIYEAVKKLNAEAEVYDAFTQIPAKFPCVTVQELNNTTTASIIGTRNKEKFARISYQIDVFSNANTGRRRECTELMGAISDALVMLNFQRVSMNPVPNYNDADIYRITARFEVIADDKNNTYRR